MSGKVWAKKINGKKTPYPGIYATPEGHIYKWEPLREMYRRLIPLRAAQVPKVRIAFTSDYAERIAVPYLMMSMFNLNPLGYLGVQYKDGNVNDTSINNIQPHTCVSTQRQTGYEKTGYKHLVVGVMLGNKVVELFPHVSDAIAWTEKKYGVEFEFEDVMNRFDNDRTVSQEATVLFEPDVISIVKVSIVEPSSTIKYALNSEHFNVIRRYCTECKQTLPVSHFSISNRRNTKWVYGIKSTCNCCLSLKK